MWGRVQAKHESGDGFLLRKAIDELTKRRNQAAGYLRRYGNAGPLSEHMQRREGTYEDLLAQLQREVARSWDQGFRLPEPLRTTVMAELSSPSKR